MNIPSTAQFLDGLGFVLAIDNCARGCAHCPTFGSTAPARRAPLAILERRLASIAAERARHGLPARVEHTVHCWRLSDPLDYTARTERHGTATAADLAVLWREHLHQGLYVVTNGSEGGRHARRALRAFAATPGLVSQVKLTVTPSDRAWGTFGYVEELGLDLRAVLPLWELPADRREADAGARRLRLNVKHTDRDYQEARAVATEILQAAGLGATSVRAALEDPSKVAFKQIYDLGTATGAPSPVEGAANVTAASTGRRFKPTSVVRRRVQYGIRPAGRRFVVDMYAFTETELTDPDSGDPSYWQADALAAAHA